jgi:SAM-dependent methyltransferase
MERHRDMQTEDVTGGPLRQWPYRTPRLFDAAVAARYEDWFKTPFGRRAEREERAFVLELLGWLGGPRSILEVGCGTARFARWLSQREHKVVGLDRSPAMLAEARQLAPHLPLVLGDAHALPIGEGAFDVVLFVTTLEFLEDPGRALQEAARVARRGLVLGVLNRWSLAGVRRFWRHGSVRAAGRLLRPAELEDLVRQALDGRVAAVTSRVGVPPWGARWLGARCALGEFIAMGVRLRA